jgi:diacylglycerol kinase
VPPIARTGRELAISPSTTSDKLHRRGLPAAFGYAAAGLGAAWRAQPNLRVHAGIAVVVIATGLLLHLPLLAWGLLVFAIALVLVAELLNTAVETLVDLVSPGDHPLAKQTKDVAAAAVLVAAAGAVAIGLLVAGWALARAAAGTGGML